MPVLCRLSYSSEVAAHDTERDNRPMTRRFVQPLTVLCIGMAACTSTVQSRLLPRGALHVTTDSGKATLDVEIAAEGRARQVGLMGRPSLPADAGMVFLYDESPDGGFWMKDTLIPLSIAFWDRSGRILKILDMVPCRQDPCPLYQPGVAYFGAVEANLGWFADHGVRPGHRVALSRD
jgi:uncharacterized protein